MQYEKETLFINIDDLGKIEKLIKKYRKLNRDLETLTCAKFKSFRISGVVNIQTPLVEVIVDDDEHIINHIITIAAACINKELYNIEEQFKSYGVWPKEEPKYIDDINT